MAHCPGELPQKLLTKPQDRAVDTLYRSIQSVQLKTQLQVDDIICHLDGTIAPALCQRRFESCADIVIPHSMQIPLADPETPEDVTAAETAASVPPSDLSPFLFLLGLADMAEDGGSNGGLIPNLTSNVLSSINDVFDGIQITALGNETVHDIMNDNNTINIFQNVQIIFDDSANGEDGEDSNHTMVFMVNGTGVRVDITDPAIVFDPSSLVVQG